MNNDGWTDTPSSLPSSTSSEGQTSSTATTPDETSQVRIVEVAVDDWSFSPAALVAEKGEKLIVRVVGKEGVHSFAIPDLGINARIEPGQTVDVEIPTDKAGTFAFRCMVPCGAGHRDMKGTLVVG